MKAIVSLLLLATGCAAATTTASTGTRFTVQAPTNAWAEAPAEESDKGAMLVLKNGSSGALIRFEERPSEAKTAGYAALEISDELANLGVTVSEIDFSDPTDRVASFTLSYDRIDEAGGPARPFKGKVTVLRLPNKFGNLIVAMGLWPAEVDGPMTAELDAILKTALVK